MKTATEGARVLWDKDTTLATEAQPTSDAIAIAKTPPASAQAVVVEKPQETSLLPTVEAKQGGVELIEQLALEWRFLCQENSADEPFFHLEWIAAYTRAYLPSGTLLLLTARTGGKLSAVLPLMKGRISISGIPMQRLRGAYRPYTCRFDLTRRDGPLGDVALNALWAFLKDLPDWDVLEFPDVPQGGALEDLLRLAEADGCPTGSVRSMNSPYVSLSGWGGREDYFLRQVNSSFASTFRRRRHRLTEQGPLTLRASKDADPDLLRLFFDLEASGWKGHRGSAIRNDPRARQFYEEIARSWARLGYFRLHFLEHQGKVIAGQFGCAHRHRHSLPKGARAEEYDRYGPGHLLIEVLLRDCAEQGMTELDLLSEADPWKLSWTSLVRPHAHLYVFRKNPQGRLAHLAKFKLKPALRRLLGKQNLAQ